MTMTHPGLPALWGLLILAVVVLTSLWALLAPAPAKTVNNVFSFARFPVIGKSVRRLAASRWLLLSLKVLMVALFLLIIAAGLFGTPIPERNLCRRSAQSMSWSESAGLFRTRFVFH